MLVLKFAASLPLQLVFFRLITSCLRALYCHELFENLFANLLGHAPALVPLHRVTRCCLKICSDSLRSVRPGHIYDHLLRGSSTRGRLSCVCHVSQLHLCQAIFDMYGCTIGKASLAAEFDLIDVNVVGDGVKLSFHLLHCVVFAILINVVLVALTRIILTMLECHDRFQLFLLFCIEHVCEYIDRLCCLCCPCRSIWDLLIGRHGAALQLDVLVFLCKT